MEPATPITASAAAEGWALRLLRDTADALERTPRARKADALRLILSALAELERATTLAGFRT